MQVAASKELLVVLQSLELFEQDEALFYRLLYKNKNQHRRGIYFRKLQEIKRNHTSALKLVGLHDDLRRISRYGSGQRGCITLKDPADAVSVVGILSENAAVVRRDIAALCKAYTTLHGMFSQTYFMSFAIVFISIVSRFYAFERVLLQHLCATVRELCSLSPKARAFVADSADYAWILDRSITIESLHPNHHKLTAEHGGDNHPYTALALTYQSHVLRGDNKAVDEAGTAVTPTIVSAIHSDSSDDEQDLQRPIIVSMAPSHQKTNVVPMTNREVDGEDEEAVDVTKKKNKKMKKNKKKKSINSSEVRDRGSDDDGGGGGGGGGGVIGGRHNTSGLHNSATSTFDLFGSLRPVGGGGGVTATSATGHNKKHKSKEPKLPRVRGPRTGDDACNGGVGVRRADPPLKETKKSSQKKRKVSKKKSHIDDLFSLLQ